MSTSFDLVLFFDNLLIETACNLDEFSDSFHPQTRSADERFGDFQANGVLPYAKKAKKNPRELAQKLLESLPPCNDWAVELAGPGFINFSLSPDFLLRWTIDHGSEENLTRAVQSESPSKVVVDYSSPNTAKQMHVGHIRSTIIGESILYLHFRETKSCGISWATGALNLACCWQSRAEYILDNLGDDPIAKLNLYAKALCKRRRNCTPSSQAKQVKLQEETLKICCGKKFAISVSLLNVMISSMSVRPFLGRKFSGIKWKRYTTDWANIKLLEDDVTWSSIQTKRLQTHSLFENQMGRNGRPQIW